MKVPGTASHERVHAGVPKKNLRGHTKANCFVITLFYKRLVGVTVSEALDGPREIPQHSLSTDLGHSGNCLHAHGLKPGVMVLSSNGKDSALSLRK